MRWDGASWTTVGSSPGAYGGETKALRVFDDDRDGTPSLFAGGWFYRWDGVSWTRPGGALNGQVFAIEPFNEGNTTALYVGGLFSTAGSNSSQSIARWGCGDPLFCYANCDLSTTPPILSINDFQCFIHAFATASPYANCDRSSSAPVLNVNDFQCFLNAFAVGCP